MIARIEAQLSVTPCGSSGTALEVGVEDAVEHACRVLGAHEVATEPEELVSDPGEHQIVSTVASSST